MQSKNWRRAAILASSVGGPYLTAAALGAPISFVGGTYTQNFSSLPIQVSQFNSATSGSFPTGTAASATPTGTFSFTTLSNPFDLDASNTGGGLGISQLAGFFGGSSAAGQFGAQNGNTSKGGVLDFGMNAGATNSGERFLGLLSTSTTGNDSYFGLGLINDTSSPITTFNLSFVAALWRQTLTTTANGAKTLYIGYETAPASSAEPTASAIDNNLLTSIGSVNFAAGSANAAVDGTNAANQKNFSQNVTIPNGGLAVGSDLFLDFYFNNDTGSGQGIGISTLSFSLGSGSGTGTGGQTDTYIVGAGSGAFDTTTVNFTANSSPTKYTDGDAVIFPDNLNGGIGTVNVTVASVSPSSITVSNNSGTYTLIGNPINGTGSLTKTGTGALVLSPTTSNGYTGGTNINGGQVVIASDAALGAPTGGVSLNGGILVVNGIVNSARALSLGANGGTLVTGANDATFASASGTGAFDKFGSGNLTFTGAFATGPLAVSGGNLTFTGTGSSTLAAVTINPGSGTLALPGNIVLSGPVDFAVQGVSSTNFSNGLAGTGSILVQSTNTAIHNLKSTDATIANNIVLNSNDPLGASFTAGDVTNSNGFVPGSFATVIGGATGGSGVNFLGQISGFSDVVITNDAKAGGGAGTMYISTPATYHGTTVIDLGKGQIVSNVDNALPVTTDVSIGGSASGVDGLNGNTNGGTIGVCSMNLNGHNQQFSSISDGDNFVVGSTNTAVTAFNIINTSSTTSTFTISGSTNPTNGWSAGAIGVGSTNNNINLVKGGTNNLILNNTSTYTGSTTILGGTLSIGSSLASVQGISESIASTNIILQGIDSHAALSLFSASALANGSSTEVNVTTGGAGVEIDLNYSGTQVLSSLLINGLPAPYGIYNQSQEPSADSNLFVGSGSIDVVPEPSMVGILAIAAPAMLRRRRRQLIKK